MKPSHKHIFERWRSPIRQWMDPDHFLGQNVFETKLNPAKVQVPTNFRKKGDKIYELELMLPGYKKEDITISIKRDVLYVEGRKIEKEEDKDFEYVFKEFEADVFEKRFRLSPEISRDQIKATFRDGILYISFLNVEEKGKANRVIPVS